MGHVKYKGLIYKRRREEILTICIIVSKCHLLFRSRNHILFFIKKNTILANFIAIWEKYSNAVITHNAMALQDLSVLKQQRFSLQFSNSTHLMLVALLSVNIGFK